MPSFLKTQMKEAPYCFIINSDEDWSDEENGASSEELKIDLPSKDSHMHILNKDDPLKIINLKGTATSKIDITKLSGQNSPISFQNIENNCDERGSTKEPSWEELEFDFQAIDEAEETAHILKVRVHANYCLRCGLGFVQPKRLNTHLEKNECNPNGRNIEKSLTCSICCQGFYKARCLRHHFMLHAQTKSFRCKQCFRLFVTQRNLYSHYRKYHKDFQPFGCSLCSKTFKSSKELAAHKKGHISERPYVCNLCRRRFNRPTSLKAHKRIHEARKPFKCKFCWLRYGQNSIRNLHMRTHTKSIIDRLKLVCELCGLQHVRANPLGVKFASTSKKVINSEDIICLSEDSDDDLPRSSNQIRKSSTSSIEIVEDPLQFTIDLDDD